MREKYYIIADKYAQYDQANGEPVKKPSTKKIKGEREKVRDCFLFSGTVHPVHLLISIHDELDSLDLRTARRACLVSDWPDLPGARVSPRRPIFHSWG